MSYVYLTGYENDTIDEFLKKIRQKNIKLIFDIREKPISRKKGFSKKALGQYLQSFGIEYIHMPELGSPTADRKKLRSDDGDYLTFFKSYRHHIRNHDDAVSQIIKQISKQKNIALMCYELKSELCHRSLVADQIAKAKPTAMIVSI